MPKCENCKRLKKLYIPASEEYKYHCSELLLSDDMTEEDVNEESDCEYFEQKEKSRCF